LRPDGADHDPAPSSTFSQDVLAAVTEVCQVPAEAVYVKLRQRQRGAAQYDKLDSARDEFIVREGGHRFLVNLSDYLDTGLFLDHRETRALVQRLSAGKRVLNLFAYTGSFSVYAAAGGARSTVSMDLSRTYLDWAGRNFAENRLDPRLHVRVRADVMAYLHDPRRVPEAAGPFDLVVLDPPTFSNSKKMTGTLDVLRDHPWMIERALRLLTPDGQLLFSCNHHRFSLRADEAPGAHFEDLSQRTLPRDFHDQRTHRCYLITHARRPASQPTSRGNPQQPSVNYVRRTTFEESREP
jgi:23S rRNA (cytosine1962-C5)-methyltransferase